MNDELPPGATATADSPTAEDVLPATPSTATDESASASSTEGEKQETFSQKVERLERGESAKPEVSPTTETKKPESEAEAEESTAHQDEPAGDEGKAKDPTVLSQQQQDEALNKSFDERPEWKKALSLVPKEKRGEMREAMRQVLSRETQVAKQVEEKFKPVAQKYDRLKKAVGDDESAENAIVLTELFQRGDPRARTMLQELINDLDARTGAVLTSPDLTKRAEAIDAQLEQGLLTPEEAKQKKDDLLEIQKARVGKQQTESRLQETERTEAQKRFDAAVDETVAAANDWEKEKMVSDPDYPALKKLVEDRAFKIGDERQRKLKGRLLNGTELKAVLDQALKEVKDEALKLQPKPQRRQVFAGGGSSATARRAPANSRERLDQLADKYEANL